MHFHEKPLACWGLKPHTLTPRRTTNRKLTHFSMYVGHRIQYQCEVAKRVKEVVMEMR